MNKRILLFLILILLSVDAKKSFSFGSEEDKLIINGTKYLLNLEWKKAGVIFERLKKLKPHHPVSYFYMGFTLFVTDMNTFENPDKLKILKDIVEQGNYYANRLENPNKTDKLYIIGIKAMKAFYDFRVGNFAAAIATGLRLLLDIQKLYDAHPEYADGKIGMGTYHLLLTQMPGTIKKVLSVMNLKASKEMAVKLLKEVSEKGKFFNDSALSLLSYYRTFYLKDMAEARKDLSQLMSRYPRNYFYNLNYIYTFYYEKKYSECLNLIEKHKQKLHPLFDSNKKWLFRFEFLQAQILFSQKNFNKSYEIFQKIIKERQNNWKTDYYCVYAILFRGMIYDVQNKRELALNSYHLLSRHLTNHFVRAKEYAEKFIKKPFDMSMLNTGNSNKPGHRLN